MPSSTPDISGLESLIEMAKSNLAQRLSISAGDISLVEAKPVVWPDSSLGCGQPAEVYMPVITPGFRILLEVDRQVYSYHTNSTNHFILCEMPKPILINPTPSR